MDVVDAITLSLLFTGVTKVAQKFTGTVKEKIFERAADKLLDAALRKENIVGEMNQQEFSEFFYSLLMDTREVSPKEADRYVLEVVSETRREFESLSHDLQTYSHDLQTYILC